MPRYSRTVRLKQKTAYRAELAGTKRTRSGQWIDPFPWVFGTVPEKMVYAELSRRRIPFLFLNDVSFNFPEIELTKEFQADFRIDSLKLIIEVQGAFWHSKPKTIESDAVKMAFYELGGYRVLAWWDYDIMTRLQELFAADAALTGASNMTKISASAELPVQKRTKIDSSKGIRTLNRKRALAKSWKRKAVRVKR